jgi:hypothetical protein
MGKQDFIRAIIGKEFKDWNDHTELIRAELLFREKLRPVSQ